MYFDRLNRADGSNHGLQKGDGQAKSARRGLAAKYTLLVFSDHPGGILMWRENIRDVGTHKVVTPKKWGKITIRLESLVMGLDVQTVIEGGPCPYRSKQSEEGEDRYRRDRFARGAKRQCAL